MKRYFVVDDKPLVELYRVKISPYIVNTRAKMLISGSRTVNSDVNVMSLGATYPIKLYIYLLSVNDVYIFYIDMGA